MKNVRPCTFLIVEFETKPQTSLLHGTGCIHAAFAGEVLKIGHPCPILSFEFCLTAKHHKNGTTAVHGGKAVKPNRQNVFCGAERIVIGFYAGNAAGRMSTGFRSSLSVCSKLKCRI